MNSQPAGLEYSTIMTHHSIKIVMSSPHNNASVIIMAIFLNQAIMEYGTLAMFR